MSGLMARVGQALVVILSTGFVVACNAPEPEHGNALSVQIDSSGAVPLVMVSGEAPEWTLDSLAVIRADPEIGFSSVRSIALDPRGGVWVADIRERRVSRWSDAGEWIEDRGSVGAGPGEFRWPASVVVYDGGLFVYDPQNSRVLRFALTSGIDTAYTSTSRLTGDAMLVRLFDNPDGPLLIDAIRVTRQSTFVRVSGRDSLTAPVPVSRANDSKVCPLGDMLRIFASPFAPYPLTVPVGNGIVQSDGDGSYRLRWHDAQGQLKRIVERRAERAVVAENEFLAATSDWRRFSDSMGSPTCDGEIIRYEQKPSVRALLPVPDGLLWVEQQRPERVVLEIWSADSLVAKMPAPERAPQVPPAMLGERLAVVRDLPDGGHEVRLFRIRKSAPPE